MTKYEEYSEKLRQLQEWEPYLLEMSGLPGPRANLELVQAAADLGDAARFEAWLTYTPELANTNSPQVFLAVCGAVGLGKFLVKGEEYHLETLRILANDPRWRMREAVAMALQRWGKADMPTLVTAMEIWAANGTLLEKRAAAAAICEPQLLKEAALAQRVLIILEAITKSLLPETDRRSEDFKTLRKGLAYCWSVAVAVFPEAGKPFMEKWMTCDDRDVHWIMKQNLAKARLERMDEGWVAQCLELYFA